MAKVNAFEINSALVTARFQSDILPATTICDEKPHLAASLANADRDLQSYLSSGRQRNGCLTNTKSRKCSTFINLKTDGSSTLAFGERGNQKLSPEK